MKREDIPTYKDPDGFEKENRKYPCNTQYMVYNPLLHRYYLTPQGLLYYGIDAERYYVSTNPNKVQELIEKTSKKVYDYIQYRAGRRSYQVQLYRIATAPASIYPDQYYMRKQFEEALAEQARWIGLPMNSMVISNSMTQKSLPQVNRVEQVGNINLSAGRTISLTFDGYVNAFVEEIVANSLVADMIEDKLNTDSIDINKSIYMRVTRREKQYIYACVIKEHTIQIQEDTGNEVHNLTLTARGIE